MEREIIGSTGQASDVHVRGDEGAWSACISHWFTQSLSPPNISSVLHLQSPIRWGHEPLPMAKITAWRPPRSNEIERGGKWETGQAGKGWRRMGGGGEEEERVEDKKGDNGREEEDGDEGGWRFINVPLWRMKRRKSEMCRERERESDWDGGWVRVQVEKDRERYGREIAFL